MTDDHSAKMPHYLTFKGGRLTKYKGVVSSLAPYALAPSLAIPMAFAVSFGAASLMGTTALNATPVGGPGCVLTAPDVFECSGAATTTQTLSGANSLTVTTTPGFRLTIASGNGFTLYTPTSSTGPLIFNDQNGSSISGVDTALHATQRGDGGLTITTTGPLNGGTTGIYTENYGAQATVIDAQGEITAGVFGVRAVHRSGPSGLTISTTNVTAGIIGLSALAYGGDVDISSSGTITVAPTPGSSTYTYGVRAEGSPQTGNMTIGVNTVNVTSGGGIYARSISSGGMLTITASGAITTTRDAANSPYDQGQLDFNLRPYGAGVYAFNTGSGGTQISVATIDAFGYGVYAFNGQGALKITATGDITGGKQSFFTGDSMSGYQTSRRRYGIEALNNGTDLIIDVQGVSGTEDGIDANNAGSGELRITTSGDVIGGSASRDVFSANGNGIEAYNYGTNLIIDAKGSVTANDEGIDATNHGSGNLYITASGPVIGGFAPNPQPSYSGPFFYLNVGEGIQAYNGPSGVNLRIEAADVSGYGTGIDAENLGTGSTYISSTGTVIGGKSPYSNALSPAGVRVQMLGDSAQANLADGIYALNGANTTGLTIKANNVYGGRDGIFAENEGSGALSITTTGKVSGGPGGDDYDAHSTMDQGPSGVSDAQGSETARSVSAVPIRTPSFYSGVGIYAKNGRSGSDLIINAMDVSGYGDAVTAVNNGTGMLSITTTGTVVGGKRTTAVGVLPAGITYARNNSQGNGISAYQSSTGTGLSITSGSVTGGNGGILALSRGSGDLKIEAQGPVTGTSSYGIGVQHQGTGAIQIVSDTVTGGNYGVYASHLGSGSVTITANTVTANTPTSSYTPDILGSGIIVRKTGTGDIAITSKDTSGPAVGIFSDHYGDGNTTITSTGTASGNFIGIAARATSGDVKVMSNNSNGSFAGIYGAVTNSGTLTIESTGAASSSNGHGIATLHRGTGHTAITATGATTGTNGAGILVYSPNAGSTATVDIAAQVTGGSGRAVDMEFVDGAAKLVLRDGFGLTGQAITQTGDTDDTLELAQASASPFVARASGSPTLDLSTIGNTGHASGIIGFENLSVTGGSWTLTGTQTAGAFTSASFTGGAATLDSATLLMNSSNLTVGSAGTLGVNGASMLTGGLSLAGKLNMQDGAAGDTLAVSGDFAGGGSVILDADLWSNTADQLNISGNVSGKTGVTVNGVNPNLADGRDITLVTVGGTTDADDFILTSGQLSFGVFNYDLALDAAGTSAWKLRSTGLSGTGVAYQNALNVIFGGSVSLQELLPMLKDQLRASGLTASRDALSFSTKGEGSAKEQLVWARSFGHWESGDTSGGGSPFSFENNTAGVQVGVRALSHELGNGTLTVDLFTEAKQISGSARNANGTGSSEGSALGIGTAALWDSGSGFYLGALAHVAHVKSDVSSSNGGRLVTGHKSVSQSFVVEGGYTFNIASNVSLTPSASLAYTHLQGGRFTDAAGNVVVLGSNDSLKGTVGAELATLLGNGTQLHAAGYVTQELSGALSATAGSVSLNGGEAPTMFELSAGAKIPLGDATDIFVDGTYGHSFESGANKRESYSVSFGIKAIW